MRVGKFPAIPLPNDYKIERRNDVKPLVTAPDAGDKVGRSVAAETGLMPILARPFRLEHLLKIELATTGRRAIVPPA